MQDITFYFPKSVELTNQVKLLALLGVLKKSITRLIQLDLVIHYIYNLKPKLDKWKAHFVPASPSTFSSLQMHTTVSFKRTSPFASSLYRSPPLSTSLLQKLVYLSLIPYQVNVYLTFLKALSNRLSSIVTLLDTKKPSNIHLLDTVLTSSNLWHLTLITCQIRLYTWCLLRVK